MFLHPRKCHCFHTTLTLNMTAFWDVAPCSLVEVDWLYTLLEIFSKTSCHFRRLDVSNLWWHHYVLEKKIRGATGSDELWPVEQPPLAVFPDCTRHGTGLTCGQHIESHSCIFSFPNRTVTSLSLCIRMVPNPTADINKGRRWNNEQFLVLHSNANEVGGACSTHGGGEKSVQGFCGKARRKETTGKTKA
jgi:hypothetical protein